MPATPYTIHMTELARKNYRTNAYAAYKAEQMQFALVTVWPSCESCNAGATRPCKSWCPTIAHIYS